MAAKTTKTKANRAKKTKGMDPLEGKSLPKVKLNSTEGKPVTLPSDWKGNWTLLYFYPRDNTPGCTKQACNYRDHIDNIEKLDLQLYGVSSDSLQSHEKFQSKYKLNFPLLVDEEHKLGQALKSYGLKKFMGRSYKGISRDTFLIDPKGVIRKVWRKVNPLTTVQETISAAKELIN